MIFSCAEYWGDQKYTNAVEDLHTLRTCTSVAGQITLILTSFSLPSPSHPKNHEYCQKTASRKNSDIDKFTYDVGMSRKLSAVEQTRVVCVGREVKGRIIDVKSGLFDPYDGLCFGLGVVWRGKRTEKSQAVRSGVFIDDALKGEFVQVRRHCDEIVKR